MVDEVRELENNPSFYTGGSKNKGKNPSNFSLKKLGPLTLLAIFGLLFIVFIFGLGNYIPDSITTLLTDATDTQCANGTVDKEWVFIETLRQGELPKDTIIRLKKLGVLVVNEGGEEDIHGTSLLKDGQKLNGNELYEALQSDISLYTAFNEATYTCATFYYDEGAEKVFSYLNTNRNNYTETSNFHITIGKAMGMGSNADINTVYREPKEETEEEAPVEGGEEEEEEPFIYKFFGSEESVNTGDHEAREIIELLMEKNPAETRAQSAINIADILKVADTVSKEQRSSSYFLYFIENIDKMKAGGGNQSKVNEALNFLTDQRETEVVDVDTTETVKSIGTPLQSPSLYAVLSGSKVSPEETKNYSSDRMLKTIESKLSQVGETDYSLFDTIKTTLASFTKRITGTISRFIADAVETTEFSVVAPLIPTVSSSLILNSFTKSVYGITGGEFLVEGATNVGKSLSIRASGASAGDAGAVMAYNKQVQQIASLNARSEAMTKSPFDITSKNTFLGSILYKTLPIIAKTSSIPSIISKSIASLIPGAHAASNNSFLTTFGNNNQTLSSISAAGTVHGTTIATFDTSTQTNPYANEEFQAFIEENTELGEDGERTIIEGSDLATYIIYNTERESPRGVTDSGILESYLNSQKKISVSTDIIKAIKLFLNLSDGEEEALCIATGASFVISSENEDWQKYKYAQRYISINRTVAALKQYAEEENAYNNLRGFEGNTNPVVAFTEKYYKEHPKDDSYEGTIARLTGFKKDDVIAVLNQLKVKQYIADYNPTERYSFINNSSSLTTIKGFNTGDNNLIISKVPNQTLTTRFVELREYIIKKNDWSVA